MRRTGKHDPPKRKRSRRLGKVLLGLLLVLLAARAGMEALFLVFPYPMEKLRRFGASRVVLARGGETLRVAPTRAGERLLPVTLREVSPHLLHALLAGEDGRFFSHGGVDWRAVFRAGWSDLLRGRIVSGASTLTMQAARIIEPGGPRLWRKVREVFRAWELERLFSKEKILEFYLNFVPLGGTLRGFEAASRYWFGKPASSLAPAEAAALVAMLPAPTRRRPDRNPRLLRFFRNLVLDRMRKKGYLDEEEWRRERSSPLGAKAHPWPFRAPHFTDMILRLRRGRVVRTGLDLGLQTRMEAAARSFGGPAVDGLALVVLEKGSGEIRAMVGSRDYRKIPLNACLCGRPAGSTLKPFLYALAFQEGIVGPDGLLPDTPMRIGDYVPANFDERFAGAVRAGAALACSRNLPALRLLRVLGVERFRDLLWELGLRPRNGTLHLDLALGTESVTPLGLARAWARFCDPASRLSVSWKARRMAIEALSSGSPDYGLLLPGSAAWKTGTSSNRRDAWTVGTAGRYVICVWLGNLDDRADPGLVGADSAALLFARAAAVLCGK